MQFERWSRPKLSSIFCLFCDSPSCPELVWDLSAKFREIWPFPAFLVRDLNFMPCWLGFTLILQEHQKSNAKSFLGLAAFWLVVIRWRCCLCCFRKWLQVVNPAALSQAMPSHFIILVLLSPLTALLDTWNSAVFFPFSLFLFEDRWDHACWSNGNNYIYHIPEKMYLINWEQCSWKCHSFSLIF